MALLKIKNFGPIKEGFSNSDTDYFSINKVSVLVGDQGTGKSTIAKLYSTFTWLEKAFVREYYKELSEDDFIELCQNQRLPSEYFSNITELGYKGKAYNFNLIESKLTIEKAPTYEKYVCPKIMYVPSERNILSVLEDVDQIKKLPQMLKEFKAELKKANKLINKNTNILDYNISYNKVEDINYIQSKNSEIKIPITKASSGLQSIIPLFLVTEFLRNEVEQNILEKIKDLSSSLQDYILNQINKLPLKEKIERFISSNIKSNFLDTDIESLDKELRKYVNSCFINIVEEPEQNLFPSSQVFILEGLIQHSINENSQLLITTHSPYILSALNNFIYAKEVFDKTKKTILEVPKSLFIDINNVSSYKIENGTIIDIKDTTYNMIDSTEIDECSSMINTVYDKLSNLGD